MQKIIIIGPAHPLRGGGITTFNQRLAKEFIDNGDDCLIYSFSLLYPAFLFPGKSQYTDEPAPKDLKILPGINSVNPLNWLKVGNRIRRERPDIVIVRYWLPLLGPALGTILKKIKKNGYTKIVCIADNIIPHEHRPGDKAFTKYFLKQCDAFVTMSEKVMIDLRRFGSDKPARLVPHPLYDNFGDIISKMEAKEKLKLKSEDQIILLFGFIRKYKGLDILLDAMKILKENPKSKIQNLKLMIAGEFYGDEKLYLEQINRLGLNEDVILRTDFIPDSEVKYYVCAADVVIQPYRNATQSGVTPLAYHFEKPMIVTNVGALPDYVPHNKVGLVAEANAASLADNIQRYFELGETYFIPHLREEKKKYSWKILVDEIIKLAELRVPN